MLLGFTNEPLYLLIIVVSGMFLGFVLFLIGIYKEASARSWGRSSGFAVFLSCLGLVIIFVSLVYFLYCSNQNKIQEEQRIEYAVEQGYTIYIDGREVDHMTIDIGSYNNIKIDDENKIIIISD